MGLLGSGMRHSDVTWPPGLACERTCRSMPASSISLSPQGADVIETLGDAAAPMLLQLVILVMFFERDDMGFGRHYCPSLGDGFPE